MGFWGLNRKEELCETISQTNKYIKKVQEIVGRTHGSLYSLSYSDKRELKEMGRSIIYNMNKVSEIVEPNQNLMMEMVPGFEGPVPAVTWMMWVMQWFDSFERTMKPLLDTIP